MAKVTLEYGDRFIAERRWIAGFQIVLTIQKGRKVRITKVWADFGQYTICIQTLSGSNAGRGCMNELPQTIFEMIRKSIVFNNTLSNQEKEEALKQASLATQQINKPILKKR